jgi:hypothetical protein
LRPDVMCTAVCAGLEAAAPGPSATDIFDATLTNYVAVDVDVLISFTRNSLLIKRRQVRLLPSWRALVPCKICVYALL